MTAAHAMSTSDDTSDGAQWRNRATMLVKADHYQLAYDDYRRAIDRRSGRRRRTRRTGEDRAHPEEAAGSALKALSARCNGLSDWSRARSCLRPTASVTRRLRWRERRLRNRRSGSNSSRRSLPMPRDTVQLDATVAELRKVAPERASTEYYAAVAAFIHGDANEAVAQRATGDRDRSQLRADLRSDRRRLHKTQSARSGAPGIQEVAVVRRARQHRLREPRRAGTECGESGAGGEVFR